MRQTGPASVPRPPSATRRPDTSASRPACEAPLRRSGGAEPRGSPLRRRHRRIADRAPGDFIADAALCLICSQKNPTLPTKSPHRATKPRKAARAAREAASCARSRAVPFIALSSRVFPTGYPQHVRFLFLRQVKIRGQVAFHASEGTAGGRDDREAGSKEVTGRGRRCSHDEIRHLRTSRNMRVGPFRRGKPPHRTDGAPAFRSPNDERPAANQTGRDRERVDGERAETAADAGTDVQKRVGSPLRDRSALPLGA